MVNKTKNLIYAFMVFIFLVARIFLSAQELTKITEISSQDFSYYGENAELIDDALVCKTGFEKCKIEIRKGDITTTIEATQGIKVSPLGKISVAESSAEFSLNGNKFQNIQSGEIIFDQTNGKITEADFFTNENPGNYNINGNEFEVSANKRFFYDSKKQEFQLSEGTKIKRAIETKIQGEDLVYFKGNEQHSLSGNLNFDEEGNAFLDIKEEVVINRVKIENSVPSSYRGTGKGEELKIFFDKNIPKPEQSEYLVLDAKKNYFEYTNLKVGPRLSGKQTLIEFQEGNSFNGDIFDVKNDFLGIEASTGAGGTLSIERPSNDALPVLKTSGGITGVSLLQDSSTISFSEHISLSQNDIGKTGTVPFRIEFKNIRDEQIIGLIPDESWGEIAGKDIGKQFLWSGKTELVKSTFGASGVGGVGQLSAIEKEKLKDANIIPFKKRVDKFQNLEEIISNCNFLINCADSPSIVETTKIIDKYVAEKNIPYCVAGGYNLHLGMIGPIIIPGITKTFDDFIEYQKQKDPLKNLEKIRDIRQTGNLGPIAGAIANIQVMEIFKYLIGKGKINFNKFAEIDFMDFSVEWRAF